jgi:hypothetical protein
MTAAPDSPHRRTALMEAAGAAGLHKLTSRVFWLGSKQATYGDHRRGMTSGAARNGLRFQLVLLRKPFHGSDGPSWSGGLRRAVP